MLNWSLTLAQGSANSLFPLRVLSVGDHHWLAVPGEPSTALSHRLESAVAGVLGGSCGIVGLSGDYIGYLTTAEEYDTQHYEGSSTLWGRGTGAWLIDHVTTLCGGPTTAPMAGGAVVWRKVKEKDGLKRPNGEPTSLDPKLWHDGRRLHGSFQVRADAEVPLADSPLVRLERRDGDGWVPVEHLGAPIDDQARSVPVRRIRAGKHDVWSFVIALPDAVRSALAGIEVRVPVVHPALTAAVDWPTTTLPQD